MNPAGSACLHLSPFIQTSFVLRFLPPLPPFFSTSRQPLILCVIPLYYKRGTRHSYNNKVPPWGSEVAKSSGEQMMIFLNAEADSSEASACCPMTCNSEQHSESVGLLSKRARSVCNFAAHTWHACQRLVIHFH